MGLYWINVVFCLYLFCTCCMANMYLLYGKFVSAVCRQSRIQRRRNAPNASDGATRRMLSAAQRAECYQLRGFTKMVIKSTCKPKTDDTPPPPLRGGGVPLCALLPTAAGAAAGSAPHCWRQRAFLRRNRPKGRFLLRAAHCRLRRGAMPAATPAAVCRAQRRPPPPRIGGNKCELPFTFGNCWCLQM